MLFCGIDVAKHRHELCLTDDGGNIVQQMFIDNSQKGLGKFLQVLDRLQLEPGGIEFCMETTGHYWLALYCHLVELDYTRARRQSIQSDALRNLYVRTKTDQNDALLLADLVRFGRVPETRLASETTLKL